MGNTKLEYLILLGTGRTRSDINPAQDKPGKLWSIQWPKNQTDDKHPSLGENEGTKACRCLRCS